MIDKKDEDIIKSKRTIFRRQVLLDSLNEYQSFAYDLIIIALLQDENESVTDGRVGISHLQLILGKGDYRKLYVLDSVITTLKNTYSYNDENYLVIAPIGKAVSNVSGLALYSNKEGLSLPVREKFKELIGERLSFL